MKAVLIGELNRQMTDLESMNIEDDLEASDGDEVNDLEKPLAHDEDESEFIERNQNLADALLPRDINLVIKEAGCSRERAICSLIKHDGDLVLAIISIVSK